MADVKVTVLGGNRGPGSKDIARVLLPRFEGENAADIEPAAVINGVHPLLRKVVDGDDDSNYTDPSYRQVPVKMDI